VRVEKQLDAWPPSWPEEVPQIDRDKAKVGKALFMENCASCHKSGLIAGPNRTIRETICPRRTDTQTYVAPIRRRSSA